jgi:hypothetical protein
MATACAALSTQRGICMSCGLASSNPGRNMIALGHWTNPPHGIADEYKVVKSATTIATLVKRPTTP